ncbi:MAG: dTDP-4-dehydrorhamnose reductase [Ilumatobacteraceae bacterium]
MKILVTGAKGQLGTELMQVIAARGDDGVGIDIDSVDITQREIVHDVFAEIRPDAVINCAAWTAVDACEDDPDKALTANGVAVRWVAEACDAIDAHLVHVSTDYVFDGTKPTPYVETDIPNPQSVYGTTKLAGEAEALSIGTMAAVVRTSWVCGFHGNNMVKTVHKLAQERDSLSFVSDQIGHPTFTSDLAPLLHTVATDRLAGIFHGTNQGAVSWYEFVREIVRLMGRDPSMVHSITTAELQPPRPAKRPANSVLDNKALRDLGYAPTRDFREPLAELLARLRH